MSAYNFAGLYFTDTAAMFVHDDFGNAIRINVMDDNWDAVVAFLISGLIEA